MQMSLDRMAPHLNNAQSVGSNYRLVHWMQFGLNLIQLEMSVVYETKPGNDIISTI